MGVIWLPVGEDRAHVVTHEWGHIIQEALMGPVLYFITIGIPSFISANLLPEYHRFMPWELSADFMAAVFSGGLREHMLRLIDLSLVTPHSHSLIMPH